MADSIADITTRVAQALARLRTLRAMLADRHAAVRLALDREGEVLAAAEVAAAEIDEGLATIAAASGTESAA